MDFVHLHVHSQYSLLEASCRPDLIVKKTLEHQQSAVALTDNGNMFGAVEFYFAAKDKNIKAILGTDLYLAPRSRLQKGEDKETLNQPNRRLVLLAQNLEGYQNLCKISSIGYQEGFYYKPRVDYDVLNRYNAGIIALSGGKTGDVLSTFDKHGADAAIAKIEELKKIFGDRFYLEVCRTSPEWTNYNQFLCEAGEKTKTKIVATNNVHYLEQEDQIAQEVLICIGSNKTLQDESRFRLGTDQFYFKSSEMMRSLFQDLPQACDATLEIAERCDVKFKLKDANGKSIYHLPSFNSADESSNGSDKGQTQSDLIRSKALEGLELRYREAEKRGENVLEEKKPDYLKRLDFELGVIEKMGFTSYFLIVQDFINWAKDHSIPVGPGRGSGAGSLVAYVLRITDLDPVRYNLLFERFLNPERISMPDFDIDFCQDKRPLVIDYVTKKYGETNVSQIITYGKLQARAAIRDVGRVLGMAYSEVDVISKFMPDKLGITLKEAIEMEPRIKEAMEANPQIATLMDLAQRVEGLVRHAGIHAAGIIISNRPLVEYAPLYKGADGENVVQYDMKYAEKIGLIKFDFLGLKTLTHIQNALDLIEQNRGIKILPQDIPVSDPGIYEIMSKGDTLGIFQFEGDGITDTLRKIKPSSFEDITAINALYRPGPMDMIPEYTARKHGEKKPEYLFKEIEEVLSETYGIIIYQEQVMSIASLIGGYSLGEADMLRRAMGKKLAEEMNAQKKRFLDGAQKKGFDEKKAAELFDLMEKFASYGFNKSHAAAYCVVAAQTAWLKKYYPVEFFAALLSTEMSNTDNIVRYVKDARAHGIEVRPPNINYSDFKFSIKDNTIFFSLGAIKGVGEAAVESIISARNSLPDKKFAGLEQFFEVVDRKVNKKTIESLIKAGGFDGFGSHRAQLFAGYEKYLNRASVAKQDREIGQVSLFDMLENSSADHSDTKVVLDQVTPWNRSARLAYEKEILGFYLSEHPLSGLGKLYNTWTTCEIEGLKNVENKKRVVLAGLVMSLREIITKKGTRMAFAQLEDLTDHIELVIFPDVYKEAEKYLKEDHAVLIGGNLEKDGDSKKILVDRVAKLEDILKKSKQAVFRIDHSMQPKMTELYDLLFRYPGNTEIEILIDIPELDKVVSLDLEGHKGIDPSTEFFDHMQNLFGRTDFIELRI
jgi:DNA polymerase-3 subunit alpha